jgi:ATP-dependent protease HslVU (ClpYQ) peptidase subunit
MKKRISCLVRRVVKNKVVLAAGSGFAVAAASALTANAQVNMKQVLAAGLVGAVGAVKLLNTEPPTASGN